MTKIQWTDITLNPIHLINEDGSHGGHWCHKNSPECLHCYAEAINNNSRFAFASHRRYSGEPPNNLILNEKILVQIAKASPGKKVFVSSMTDAAGDWLDLDWIEKILDACLQSQATIQFLTKFPNVLNQVIPSWLIKHNLEEVPSRLWIGATVGCKSSLWRVEELLEIPAATRWLSCEPLLEDLGEISLSDIHWVVGGGETKGRPCNVEDLISLKYQCDRQGVKYFCKQLGSKPYFKGKRLKLLSRSGGDIEEFPPELRVREFPKIKTGI